MQSTGDPLTKSDALSQMNNDKSHDSGSGSDFLNDVSNSREYRQKSLPIALNDEIGTVSNSLKASDNGKSES
jgi:hypothetical protein